MIAIPLPRLRRLARRLVAAARARLARWTRPATLAVAAGAAADATRSRSELFLENALLRHQVAVLGRTTTARIPAETVNLIQRMAAENRLWGADRLRGELLKLDVRVSKRTIQKYLRLARPRRPAGQPWSTFLRAHAAGIWACDFLPVTDRCFRPLYAFFVIALGSRRVVHVGVTRHPTDRWVAQQLREATPYGECPPFLSRDNDGKYGPHFDRVAAASGIRVLRTPIRAPRANATCERFLGSARREGLDQLPVLSEAHLRRALREYVAYFNRARPHQGIGQAIPARASPVEPQGVGTGRIVALPVLGGLHHDYRRAA
jgi:transposase InsO family protein